MLQLGKSALNNIKSFGSIAVIGVIHVLLLNAFINHFETQLRL